MLSHLCLCLFFFLLLSKTSLTHQNTGFHWPPSVLPPSVLRASAVNCASGLPPSRFSFSLCTKGPIWPGGGAWGLCLPKEWVMGELWLLISPLVSTVYSEGFHTHQRSDLQSVALIFIQDSKKWDLASHAICPKLWRNHLSHPRDWLQ